MMKNSLAALSGINFVLVVSAVYVGLTYLIFPALITAIVLLVHCVPMSGRPLALVGSMFNFTGVVLGSTVAMTAITTGSQDSLLEMNAAVNMAVLGAMLLFIDISSSISRKS